MFRNVDRLFNHLASPSEGLGKKQWLRAREERCARRADQARSINCLTGVGVEVPSSTTKNIAHGVCASGQPHPHDHRTTTARTIFVSEALQRAEPLRLEIGQIAGGLVRALWRSWNAIGRF